MVFGQSDQVFDPFQSTSEPQGPVTQVEFVSMGAYFNAVFTFDELISPAEYEPDDYTEQDADSDWVGAQPDGSDGRPAPTGAHPAQRERCSTRRPTVRSRHG